MAKQLHEKVWACVSLRTLTEHLEAYYSSGLVYSISLIECRFFMASSYSRANQTSSMKSNPHSQKQFQYADTPEIIIIKAKHSY